VLDVLERALRSAKEGPKYLGAGKVGVTKWAGTEGRSFNCGAASASVLQNDQFKSDMERGVRGRESLVLSWTLVLSRASGECSLDIYHRRKSILGRFVLHRYRFGLIGILRDNFFHLRADRHLSSRAGQRDQIF